MLTAILVFTGLVVLFAVLSLYLWMNDCRPFSEDRSEKFEVGTITRIIRKGLFSSQEESRIMVKGAESRSPICQICLGRIKQGSRHLVCDCGRAFHIVCLSRTEFCPYCDNSYEDLQTQASTELAEPLTVCPLCDSYIAPGNRECRCGAVFLEEGSDFYCPSCGTLIPWTDDECSFCGQEFDRIQTITCPICGQINRADRALCDCGVVIADRCPECGSKLGAEDEMCGGCGAIFEFIG